MTTVSVALSAKALGNLPTSGSSGDFTFIVGQRPYSCPSIVAEFISPRVRGLHSVDSTITELVIGIDDPDGLFRDIISLSRGAEIAID
jgi:hypothetical protein